MNPIYNKDHESEFEILNTLQFLVQSLKKTHLHIYFQIGSNA